MVLLSGTGMIFLPVKNSFKLVLWGNLITPPVLNVTSENNEARTIFLPVKDSFKFVLQGNPITPSVLGVNSENISETENISSNGKDKRAFLKVATIAGAGLVASQILPKRAEALIMGSSPTTGVVGVKNASNVRINPATEETVSSLLKTSDLTFDAGSLQVKVTSLPGAGSSSFSDSGDVARSGLVDADRHLQVDVLSSALPSAASTETTLQTIAFGGTKYAVRFVTVGSVDYLGEAAIGSTTSSAVWRVKKIDNTTDISITWAGTGTFNQVWDNYASLTYS